MSTDLVTANSISSTAQPVASQNGDDSNLSISTNLVQVDSAGTSSTSFQVNNKSGNRIVSVYEGGQNNGNLIVANSDGDRVVRLAGGTFTSYINNGTNVGIGTDNPEAQLDVKGSLQASGQVTLSGLQPTSSAPSSDTLEAVFVDTKTGVLYYQ